MGVGAQAEGLARYGLHINPYNPRPLNLLHDGSDGQLLRDITDDLRDAREYVERAAAQHETAFVLVLGTRGTGRTTIANHLMARYRDARGIAPARFVVPECELKGRDGYDIIVDTWFPALYWALRPTAARERDLTIAEAGQDLRQELHEGTGLGDRNRYVVNARELMARASQILEQGHQAAFGVLLERVESEDIVNAAFNVFEKAETLVVLTSHENDSTVAAVRRAFLGRQPRGRAVVGPSFPVLRLGCVAGLTAKELIKARWHAAIQSPCDLPFDEAGVVSAFDAYVRVPGRVLELTADVLETKAATLDPGEVWPDAREELEIDAARFLTLLKQADSRPRTQYD
jgi:hypothetical protein